MPILLSIAMKKSFMRISTFHIVSMEVCPLVIKRNLGSRSKITYSEQWEGFACWLSVAPRWMLYRDKVPYGDAWFVLFPALDLRRYSLLQQFIQRCRHINSYKRELCTLHSSPRNASDNTNTIWLIVRINVMLIFNEVFQIVNTFIINSFLQFEIFIKMLFLKPEM